MTENPPPSQRDLEVIFAAFQCLKTPAQIDAQKLADMGVYKNASSARSGFGQLCKRLFPKDGTPVLANPDNKIESAPSTPRAPRTPKTVGKGKNGGSALKREFDAKNEGSEFEASPSKKIKSEPVSARKEKVIKAEMMDDEYDGSDAFI